MPIGDAAGESNPPPNPSRGRTRSRGNARGRGGSRKGVSGSCRDHDIWEANSDSRKLPIFRLKRGPGVPNLRRRAPSEKLA
jgi:hypothetical protein